MFDEDRRRQSKRTAGCSGFTLIELLVVIGIIAILAAFLFPVFSRAQERARLATCTSNAKQIAEAILMYTGDYDEKFPYATTVLNVNEGNIDAPPLRTVLQSYIHNDQIWQCPSWLGAHGDLWSDNTSLWRQYGTTYGYNAFPKQPQGTLYGRLLSEVHSPSSKPMVWCASGNAHSAITAADWANGATGAVNIAYVDGHVKLLIANLPQFTALVFAPL